MSENKTPIWLYIFSYQAHAGSTGKPRKPFGRGRYRYQGKGPHPVLHPPESDRINGKDSFKKSNTICDEAACDSQAIARIRTAFPSYPRAVTCPLETVL